MPEANSTFHFHNSGKKTPTIFDPLSFYEKYYYEPDEQSKEVQERSISEIPEISINDWLNNIFDKINYFRLEDKIKYTY